MAEANTLSEAERDQFLQSRTVLKRLNKMAQSLFKHGYLNLNRLSEVERDAFLASPLIIGIGDGDFRKWRGHSHGGSKFTNNLIRQA
ncbi:hypothetical protein BGZ83_007577, partial [Gryganskiella cystojenkinii]